MYYSSLCPFYFFNHTAGEEIADVLLVFCFKCHIAVYTPGTKYIAGI